MRAGAKDKRVRVYRLERNRDAAGQPIETRVFVGQRWANRATGTKVAERFAGDQRFATVTDIFRVGYSPSYAEISPDTHILVWKGATYNILGAVEIGRQDGVELLCTARGEK
jgi:head-tail adaptor